MWPQMNIIISKGLMEQGEVPMAKRLRDDLRGAIEQSGFYECFNPLTGAGCIGVSTFLDSRGVARMGVPEYKAVAA